MAARKKKRSKAYRPKAVKAPNHLLVKLLPELTPGTTQRLSSHHFFRSMQFVAAKGR